MFYEPKNIENVPVGVDADEHVWDGDELKVGVLGVGEEHLRLPNGLDQERVGQVHGRGPVLVGQPRVPPLLPQVRVCDVVLKWVY